MAWSGTPTGSPTKPGQRCGAMASPDVPLPSANGSLSLRTLPEDARRLLVGHSISPLPLHKTLTLAEAMRDAEHPAYSRYERLALAAALVADIGNLRFGPEVGIGRNSPRRSGRCAMEEPGVTHDQGHPGPRRAA